MSELALKKATDEQLHAHLKELSIKKHALAMCLMRTAQNREVQK